MLTIPPVRACFTRVARLTPPEATRHIFMRVASGTATHDERVALLALRLYESAASGKNDIDRMRILIAALFHDVGKNGVNDEVLLKPGRLSRDEYAAVQTHVEKTEWTLAKCDADRRIPLIAASHHERWDGSGYPRGYSEREIPYFARIITIADVWDALVNERAYKGKYSSRECLAVLRELRSTVCDPTLTDIFMREWERLTYLLR